MADCVLADDAYLIQAWPQVVISTPGQWLITFVAVAAGTYAVTVNGIPYGYDADGTETLVQIRDEVLSTLTMGLTFGASPVGTALMPAILITEIQASGLTVAASGPSGPAPSEVTLLQVAGEDNLAQREFWLERAECGVPNCCLFCGCSGDYTLYHASLAAHMLMKAQTADSTGFSATNAKRMELGPAKLERNVLEYATPTDADLASTTPGALVLTLKRRYMPPFMCA